MKKVNKNGYFCIRYPVKAILNMSCRFYDNHTHSQFSPDSRMRVEELVAAAIEKGLAGVSITDHLDIDAPRAKDEFLFDLSLQQKAIEETASGHSGDIEVFKGIEIGLQPKSIQKIREFVSGYDFDVVIASIHFVDGQDPFYGDYYKDKDYREAYGRTLSTIYSTAVEYKDFDVIGHFDYIARYAPYSVRDITYSEFSDYLDPLLRYLAEEGKSLEINTNTYRERNGHTPVLDIEILKRFRELGGDALSLGSDAHDYVRIGENFPAFSQLVKSCGFDYLVHYKGRKAIYQRISSF